MRGAALMRERLLARSAPASPIRVLGPPAVIGVILAEGVHVPLRRRLGLYGGYLRMPPYYLDRVVIVDAFLDLSHQLILPLVKIEGPLQRCRPSPPLPRPRVKRCERPRQLLRQREYLLIKVNKQAFNEYA